MYLRYFLRKLESDTVETLNKVSEEGPLPGNLVFSVHAYGAFLYGGEDFILLLRIEVNVDNLKPLHGERAEEKARELIGEVKKIFTAYIIEGKEVGFPDPVEALAKIEELAEKYVLQEDYYPTVSIRADYVGEWLPEMWLDVEYKY